ncbi:hypothetical protein [Achromobacter sp. DH1f]|uniref:hypothetical protein n=1 Tax=Achromobacter sp. DH1f TaxID=1397275 RepID=UPI00046A2811|nr:hypothetical protein [Achromobacter sp. DH1f]
MDKFWTYEELTRATEEKIQAFAATVSVLPRDPATLDSSRVSFLSRADGAYALWVTVTEGVQLEADVKRLRAMVDAIAKEIYQHVPDPRPASERGWKTKREWTDEEVQVAVQRLKEKVPEVWQEIYQVEKAGGDIDGLDALTMELAHLAGMYPDADLLDVNRLHRKVDLMRRKELGLI